MNKGILRKIAYELNIKLNGDIKSFIYIVCLKYLKIHKILNKNEILNEFIDIDDIQKFKIENIIIDENYDKEFENIENIGWLYQYFISEEKTRVFDNLKRNIKVEKNDIHYATGLFTPDWIVEYLVKNSLGEVLKTKSIQDIKFIDPCQGTGNILLYAFDLFYKTYLDLGFEKEEAIYSILTKNLYGTDIDKSATLLTKLILILKAVKIVSNIDYKSLSDKMNIIAICNSNDLKNKNYGDIVEIFNDADDYGSLIRVKEIQLPIEDKSIKFLIKQYEILKQKYDVVCTNPPYMGKKNINNNLSKFLKINYSDTKSELYAAFIERCLDFTTEKGYLAMITIHSWMFISSFKNLRKKILDSGTLISMLHTGAATFDDLSSFNALATSFIFKKEKLNCESCFIRLADYYNLKDKKDNIKNKKNYYYIKQDRFFEIPNQPFIYWISEELRNCFKNNKKMEDFYPAKQGLATGDNKEFVKFWYEVPYSEIGLNFKNTEEFFEYRKNICAF